MGFAMIYERMHRHRDDDERLKIDAMLRMPGAEARYAAARREAAGAFDVEVG